MKAASRGLSRFWCFLRRLMRLCLPEVNRLMGYRTMLDTAAASGAAAHVDASSAFPDFHFEISSGSFHRFQIRIGDQFNVQVPADLDQFGGNDSHGAVVGGKSLVQLRHGPPDGGAFFQ